MKLTAVFAALLLAGIVAVGAPLVRERWSADGLYRLAERFYQAGDFEKAELACRRALRWDPLHAPAQALFVELQFILGRGSISAPTGYDSYFGCKFGVPSRQALADIDHAFERAERALGVGDDEAAERELRKILEVARWMPTGVEIAARTEQAKGRLESLQARRCER